MKEHMFSGSLGVLSLLFGAGFISGPMLTEYYREYPEGTLNPLDWIKAKGYWQLGGLKDEVVAFVLLRRWVAALEESL